MPGNGAIPGGLSVFGRWTAVREGLVASSPTSAPLSGPLQFVDGEDGERPGSVGSDHKALFDVGRLGRT